jgi:hypothetical protein
LCHFRQEPGAIFSEIGARATWACNAFQPPPFSTTLSTHHHFDHTSLDGRSFADRAIAQSYPSPRQLVPISR